VSSQDKAIAAPAGIAGRRVRGLGANVAGAARFPPGIPPDVWPAASAFDPPSTQHACAKSLDGAANVAAVRGTRGPVAPTVADSAVRQRPAEALRSLS